MSGLPLDWTLYTPGTKIPDGFFLYQNMVISLPAFNDLSAQGFFQAPSSILQLTKKNNMPAYVAAMAHTRIWLDSCRGGGPGLEGQVHNRRNPGQIVDCSS
ncbi:hypothetical protein DSO57_1032206 [Entomophthora muscae]|uniref:Uncharacterized protein n=1 Tax=Entomophthora muscae TaxID=34485 RepID=A0ACC2SD29_9FUNG|nr:hypothetical protein DSO57_1032206 [Entomophthora muscae]